PLADRTALVTGAAQGIGRAIAIRCAQDGAAVWLVDLRHQAAKLAGVAGEITAAGGRAAGIEADVTLDRPSILDHALGGPLDLPSVLVNNAGTQFFGSVTSTSASHVEQLLAVHVVAGFDLARLFVREWIERRIAGAIVNIASVAGAIHFDALSAY